MSASTDDTLPMTPFSQRNAHVSGHADPFSIAEDTILTRYTLCIRIWRTLKEVSTHTPTPEVNIMYLASPREFEGSLRYSHPTPPVISWFLATESSNIEVSERPTEDAPSSNVAGPRTTQLVTMPLSPQHMPAYANKWQGNFFIISYYVYQTTLNVCCQIVKAFATTWS
ncbi:hypothetical protein FGIG_12368 [Fasciola gigantica]|uniref:Uncharacterized protein n=1 Tax=Fasciola gigantica TaxID=46835 RepID=A0A504YKT4_FASGI|nr:hypothetical protein FGIG_12368 [Fasciola gigantica]